MRLALLLGLVGAAGAHAEPWSDTPAWPEAKTGELVWVVSPPIVIADPNAMPNQPIALEVTLGTVTRTIKLAPELGSMKPYNQPMCKRTDRVDAYPLGRGEVAKLTFYEGGAGGYVISRSGDELSVIRWSLEDGACEDKHHQPVGCPRKDKQVARLHVPAGVRLHEQILEVDDKAARHPFNCE